ncbi:MAG: hypothetical protein Q4C77_17800 [Eubacteriales bacterium]|nr:hypothetical protein [Eubacteriales bacterium]
MNTKPGGTAGVLLLSLQVIVVVGDEGIFLCPSHKKMAAASQMKGENKNERDKENPLQNLSGRAGNAEGMV